MTALDDLKRRKKEAAARKRFEERHDKRIERIYSATCAGVAHDLMGIPRIFEIGRIIIEGGGDDKQVGEAIRAYVETIRR